ncbi:MAG: hypothetical protein K0U98_07940 [Deltaproteobacteria bacterium]|nr:hypothetical protein [Deltaproteobacteria bacterium]
MVADSHLFNNTGLSQELHLDCAEKTDAEVILAAYERWGMRLVDRLEGDFSFSLWDGRRQRLLAARDPFGVRPFFYTWSREVLLFSSDTRQLIELGLRPRADPLIVGEYLFGRFEAVERTFLEGVHRLRPGHFLVATADSVRQQRYWLPSPEDLPSHQSGQEAFEALRESLLESVRRRLSMAPEVGIQLSGGMDSSSIVALAGNIWHGQGSPGRPPLKALSAIFGKMDCDESPYIEAVVRSQEISAESFHPGFTLDAEDLARDAEIIGNPFLDPHRGIFEGCAARLGSPGGSVLLTGLGGDELFHEEFFLRDLVRRGRLPRMLLESLRLSRYSHNSWPTLAFDSLKVGVPEKWKKSLWNRRRLRQRAGNSWASPALLELFYESPEVDRPPDLGFSSQTHQATYEFLQYPQMSWALESLEGRGAHRNLTVSHPFLDRSVAEQVLALSFEERIPRGRWKWLLQRSLASDLPAEVLNRRRKTAFGSFSTAVFSATLPKLGDELLSASSWKSKEFVSQRSARAQWASFRRNPTLPQGDRCWRIACLELWLRGLSGQVARAALLGRDTTG